MSFFSEYRYLNLSQNWPKYTLLNCNPAWKCSMSPWYLCSHSWDLYGHLIQPGFFSLPLCSLTAGISQDPKSKILVQLLSITAFRMLHGEATGTMSSDCYTVQNVWLRMLLSQGLSTCFVHSQSSKSGHSRFICTFTGALSHVQSPTYFPVYQS